MNTGSCHCGAVAFQLRGGLSRVYKCYCQTCRKLSGAAFSVVTKVRVENFSVTRGTELLHVYESMPGKFRYYCRNCCSPVYVTVDSQPDLVRIRLGVLDTDPQVEIAGHIWVSEKPQWQEITDSLPQYREWNT